MPRASKAHEIGHMIYWQISVTINVIWWPGRWWKEWLQNLWTVVMTHIMCNCIVLTKWDGTVAWVTVTENVENFQNKFSILTQPKPLLQYHWSNMNMTELPDAHLCWFQRNKHDITIVAPARARFVYNRGRAALTEERLKWPRLSGTVNFRIRI